MCQQLSPGQQRILLWNWQKKPSDASDCKKRCQEGLCVDVDFQPMAAGGAHFPPYYAGRSQIPGGS